MLHLLLISLLTALTVQADNGKISFAMTFDISGSMGGAIAAAKKGAKDLVDAAGHEKCLKNYWLVYDTGNETPFEFASAKKFQEGIDKLGDLNGDHNRLTELQIAMERVEPGSLIFMLTDDNPWDTEGIGKRIEELVQIKHCKFVLVRCGVFPDRGEGSIQQKATAELERIIELSNGHDFRLNRTKLNAGDTSDFQEVIRYASHNIKQQCDGKDAVDLLRSVHETKLTKDEVTIDPTIESIDIIATSPSGGKIRKIELKNEHGLSISTSVVSSNEGKYVVTATGPFPPGTYYIHSESDAADTVISVTGRGDIPFTQRFTLKDVELKDIKDGDLNPKQGSNSHVWIKMDGKDKKKVDIEKVELLDNASNVVASASVKKSGELFKSETVHFPANDGEIYRIRLVGTYDGKPLVRLSSSGVAPTQVISVPPLNKPIKFGEEVTLNAEINLLGDYEAILEERDFRNNTIVARHCSQKLKNQQQYQCKFVPNNRNFTIIVTDNAGKNVYTKNFNVEMTENLPEVKPVPLKESSQSIKEGKSASFECASAKPTQSARFVWKYKDGTVLQNSKEVKITSNATHSTLTVNKVSRDEAGAYSCELTTDGGRASQIYWLNIAEKPTIGKLPENGLSFTEDQPLKFEFKITGQPKPNATLTKDGKVLTFSVRSSNSDGETLVYEALKAHPLDAGVYNLKLDNSEGSVDVNFVATVDVETYQCPGKDSLIVSNVCENLPDNFLNEAYAWAGKLKDVVEKVDNGFTWLVQESDAKLVSEKIYKTTAELQFTRIYLDAVIAMITSEKIRNSSLYTKVYVPDQLSRRPLDQDSIRHQSLQQRTAASAIFGVTVSPKMQVITNGDKFTLTCESSVENAQFEWSKMNPDGSLNKLKNYKEHQHGDKNMATFSGASRDDTGTYVCTVNADGKTIASDTANVVYANILQNCPSVLSNSKAIAVKTEQCSSDAFVTEAKDEGTKFKVYVDSLTSNIKELIKVRDTEGEKGIDERNLQMAALLQNILNSQLKLDRIESLLAHEQVYNARKYETVDTDEQRVKTHSKH